MGLYQSQMSHVFLQKTPNLISIIFVLSYRSSWKVENSKFSQTTHQPVGMCVDTKQTEQGWAILYSNLHMC